VESVFTTDVIRWHIGDMNTRMPQHDKRGGITNLPQDSMHVNSDKHKSLSNWKNYGPFS